MSELAHEVVTVPGARPRDVFDGLIFDLDGTLWDATPTIASAWDATMQEAGLERRVTPDDIRGVAGQPYLGCVATILPDPSPYGLEAIAARLDARERAALREHGGVLYPGVPEGLRALAEHFPLFIVSNCQIWYLETFLEHSGLRACFRDWESHQGTGQPKAWNIADVVRRNGLLAPVYVGDTAGDQSAAAQAGVPFLHASYGFGTVVEPAPAFASFAEVCGHFL